MLFWSIAIAVTAAACAALFYASAGRPVNAAAPESADPNHDFRLALAGIEADAVAGKLDESQLAAAKAELAREMIRRRSEPTMQPGREIGRGVMIAGVAAVAVMSIGIYSVLGHPEMPSMPLANRPEVVAQNMDLNAAVAQIEVRLAAAPDDVRGWTVLAPAYVELGRFSDAAQAYRRIITLSGPTAELQTDLAEALLLEAGEAGSDEAISLLETAAAGDPNHVRSRLYLAAEFMRTERYEDAAVRWREALALSAGDEAWLGAARQGLAVAQSGGVDAAAADQQQMIAGMVEGLEARLAANGGSVEEWTQLVRSYIVLGDQLNAQRTYDSAVAAYPAAFDRGELDTLALSAGLTINEATP